MKSTYTMPVFDDYVYGTVELLRQMLVRYPSYLTWSSHLLGTHPSCYELIAITISVKFTISTMRFGDHLKVVGLL